MNDNELKDTPKPSYPCEFCYSEHSWPAADLAWCEKLKAWICSECWSNEENGDPDVSLASELTAARQREKAELEHWLNSSNTELIALRSALADKEYDLTATKQQCSGAEQDANCAWEKLREKERDCEVIFDNSKMLSQEIRLLTVELDTLRNQWDGYYGDVVKLTEENDALRTQVEELRRLYNDLVNDIRQLS